MIQPTPQVENEVVPVQAANPFWSERAQEEMRLRQSRPASLPASGGDRSGEGTRRPPSLQDLLGQEPAPVERPSSGLMGQMERGTIGGVQADEELIPDVSGEEQSEDMAVVKRALKELLVQTKELGNRLHRVEEKSYTSAASGSASRARSSGVVDANTAYPLGMSSTCQDKFSTRMVWVVFGLCCLMGHGCLLRATTCQRVVIFNPCLGPGRGMFKWRMKKKCQ